MDVKRHVYLHLLRGFKKEKKEKRCGGEWGGGGGRGLGWRGAVTVNSSSVFIYVFREGNRALQITRIANDGCQRLQDRVRLEDSDSVKT